MCITTLADSIGIGKSQQYAMQAQYDKAHPRT